MASDTFLRLMDDVADFLIKRKITGFSFNSGGTRKSNNEGKGIVEFRPQTWSIDLVLVIIERGNLILGVPPPWGAVPHPPKISFTSKTEILLP